MFLWTQILLLSPPNSLSWTRLSSCLTLRLWGSSALWQESCLTLISSWPSRRRGRAAWLKDHRLDHLSLNSTDSSHWLLVATDFFINTFYIFMSIFAEELRMLPWFPWKNYMCTTWRVMICLARSFPQFSADFYIFYQSSSHLQNRSTTSPRSLIEEGGFSSISLLLFVLCLCWRIHDLWYRRWEWFPLS